MPRLLLALLCACNPQDESDALMLAGTITPEGTDVVGNPASFTGEVSIVKAFGYNASGQAVFYLSSNPASTCENVAEYLDPATGTIDPSDVLLGGSCNLYIYRDVWEGSLSASDDRVVSAGTAIGCAMGEGEFALEERGNGDTDYYWTSSGAAEWWQGFPTGYSWDFSGGDGSDFTLDISMSEFEGSFIYIASMQDVPATGDVTGTVTAQWCEGLSSQIR